MQSLCLVLDTDKEGEDSVDDKDMELPEVQPRENKRLMYQVITYYMLKTGELLILFNLSHII